MKAKTGAAKGVRLPAHPKVDVMAHEKLPDNPSVEELKTAAVSISLADLEERVADVRDSWEEDSLFEEVIEELTDDSVTATGDAGTCTPEEASRLRRELREYGPAVFCQRTVDAGRYTAKKLLTAFSIKPPPFSRASRMRGTTVCCRSRLRESCPSGPS
uniref:Uncharacterized protein n=1 Tax=Bionectria ochroleuca TaxID=29856 RepID=A0A8H7NEW0_BIOOC